MNAEKLTLEEYEHLIRDIHGLALERQRAGGPLVHPVDYEKTCDNCLALLDEGPVFFVDEQDFMCRDCFICKSDES